MLGRFDFTVCAAELCAIPDAASMPAPADVPMNCLRSIYQPRVESYSSLFMIDSKKYQLELIKEWTDFPILTGSVKGKKRKEVYDKLRNKEILGIILTVGKEGLNLPSVDCIIRASGRKSIKLVKQEKGRGSRKTETKSKYLVIDTFEDDGVQKIRKRGGAWRSKEGHLRKQSKKRLAIYQQTKSAEIFQVESEEELLSTIKMVFNEK